MAEKFAFDTGRISIAFPLSAGLGDCVITKKVFDAIVEVEPNCLIDLFCLTANHLNFAKAFFGQSKNLNCIAPYTPIFEKYMQKYDLAIRHLAARGVVLEHANISRLQAASPALLNCLARLDEYNKHNVIPFLPTRNALCLRNDNISRILRKNVYYFLSSGGALPIRDDKVDIPLAAEYKPQFDALKLGKYITIYTDIERDIQPPKVKTWPIQYLVEYVALMKNRYPAIDIVQCGGGGDIKIDNVDRHFLGVDLELTKYILANSLLFVGCEGGLVHLATALGTKCLVLFGMNSVHYYGYARNINLVSEVCFPCSDVWGNGLIRFCGRGAKEPPCMLSHTPQKVCEVTCNYLKNNL